MNRSTVCSELCTGYEFYLDELQNWENINRGRKPFCENLHTLSTGLKIEVLRILEMKFKYLRITIIQMRV